MSAGPARDGGFFRDLGIGAAAVPFLLNLPGLGFANQASSEEATGHHVQPRTA